MGHLNECVESCKLSYLNEVQTCILLVVGTGIGMSRLAAGKCVWLCTTSPPHRPTKKIVSCSSGMTTTATPRTTTSANTRKVTQRITDTVVVVPGCSVLWIIEVVHTGICFFHKFSCLSANFCSEIIHPCNQPCNAQFECVTSVTLTLLCISYIYNSVVTLFFLMFVMY